MTETNNSGQPHLEVEARVSHPDLPMGRGSGRVEVTEEAFVYRPYSVDGQLLAEPMICIPQQDSKIRLGGASNRLIIVTHPDHADWQLLSSDKRMLRHPSWQDHPDIAGVRASFVRKQRFLGGLLIATFVTLGIVCLGLWNSVDPVTQWVADQVPPEAEEELGKQAFDSILAQSHVIDDPAIEAQLEILAEPLITAIDSDRYTFQFVIIEDESVNAFALPGGYMAIHTGLILRAERPEEVLGVMAHELAHVTEQHSLRVLLKHAGMSFLISSVLGTEAGMVTYGQQLLQLKFSRNHEVEADTVGFYILERARVDPKGMVDFFHTIKEEHESSGSAMDGSLSIVSTHPATDERIENLNHLIKTEAQGPPYRDIDLNFSEFQDMLRAQLATPESE